MKKLFCGLMMAFGLVLTMHAENYYTCLDTYDQLENHVGEPGIFLVRDAGNTRSGQHGDPTVRMGYAYYSWDTRAGGWRMIGKEELLKLANIDFTKLLTTDLYMADQENMRRKMDRYEEEYTRNTVTISNLMETLTILTNSFDAAQVQYLLAENLKMRQALTMITNSYITTDSSFSELKGAVSNICASASLALGGPPEFKFVEVEPAEEEPAPDPESTPDPAPSPDPAPAPEDP